MMRVVRRWGGVERFIDMWMRISDNINNIRRLFLLTVDSYGEGAPSIHPRRWGAEPPVLYYKRL